MCVRVVVMAAPSTVHYDSQQICDYVLLRHVNVGKDAENEKIYKVQFSSATLMLSACVCMILFETALITGSVVSIQ